MLKSDIEDHLNASKHEIEQAIEHMKKANYWAEPFYDLTLESDYDSCMELGLILDRIDNVIATQRAIQKDLEEMREIIISVSFDKPLSTCMYPLETLKRQSS